MRKIKIAHLTLILILYSECVLYNLYDKIVKGGIILFDNYRGVGTSGIYYEGEIRVINKFLRKLKGNHYHLKI